jgi:hypothetical protein
VLSRDDIRRALLALAGELEDMSVHCEVVVVGGAAVVLLYGARQATKDVDVLILDGIDPTLVRGAVQRVAGALDLPDDWLNDAAKGYVHGLAPARSSWTSPRFGCVRWRPISSSP